MGESSDIPTDPHEAVHEALAGFLGEGQLAVGWCLVIDVAGPNRGRHLAQRYGGGVDGTDPPMIWTAMGMLRAAVNAAEDQLREGTYDVEVLDEDDEHDDGDGGR